jgi:hypothetical protein
MEQHIKISLLLEKNMITQLNKNFKNKPKSHYLKNKETSIKKFKINTFKASQQVNKKFKHYKTSSTE